MKLSERLALLRAGYSKEEINAMIDEDAKAQPEEPEKLAEPSADQATMKVLATLANEVKDLKTAMYKKNIAETESSSGGGGRAVYAGGIRRRSEKDESGCEKTAANDGRLLSVYTGASGNCSGMRCGCGGYGGLLSGK
jgi:hypothetical protein